MNMEYRNMVRVSNFLQKLAIIWSILRHREFYCAIVESRYADGSALDTGVYCSNYTLTQLRKFDRMIRDDIKMLEKERRYGKL